MPLPYQWQYRLDRWKNSVSGLFGGGNQNPRPQICPACGTLVGINATRAFTLRLSGGRGSTVTSLGRVQTPTLTIIVERDNKIKEFKPRELHEIIGTFRGAAGEYDGRWFDEAFNKDEEEAERTKRLLHRLQLNLSAAEQQLDSENGSLWD